MKNQKRREGAQGRGSSRNPQAVKKSEGKSSTPPAPRGSTPRGNKSRSEQPAGERRESTSKFRGAEPAFEPRKPSKPWERQPTGERPAPVRKSREARRAEERRESGGKFRGVEPTVAPLKPTSKPWERRPTTEHREPVSKFRDAKSEAEREERNRKSREGQPFGQRRADRKPRETRPEGGQREGKKQAEESSNRGLSDLEGRIVRIMSHPKYRPMDKVELSRKLGVSSDVRVEIRQALDRLEQTGAIARIRKERYVLPQDADLRVGKITFHESGFAFVLDEKHPGDDLFIPAEATWVAMQGDTVVARLQRDGIASRQTGRTGSFSQRTQGRVIRILHRANMNVVGTLQHSQKFAYVVADDPRFVHNVYVSPEATPEGKLAKVNDKVVVRLTEWESRHVNPEGEIIEVLGAATAPGIDMLSIIRKYNLPAEFPEEVQEEAAALSDVIPGNEIARREDLRSRAIFTIDPDDARDFDDAIHVDETSDGYMLGVHIADVSAYVQPGSPLDVEAYKRGNSVYLVDRVIPMLPEKLSNNMCSLRPDEDKLTFSVFAEFSKSGKLKHARFARTIIRSKARLTYKQALALLQKPADSELSEHVHRAWALASKIRKLRFANGALDLDMPEVKVYLDANGKPDRIEKVENDISHQLIEEFMLIANELVARETKTAVAPSVYRIHEKPDPEKLFEYRQIAATHGYKAGDLTEKDELQKLIASFKGSPDEPALKIGLLKSLKRACYDPQPLGHYGLSKVNYTHFTSPIRRYADLVVHRVMGALLAKQPVSRQSVSTKNLGAVCGHISDTERMAAEAERESVKLKKLEFFTIQSTADERQRFRAIVTDVKNYGLVVELPDLVISGLIHISALSDDFYTFDPVRLRFFGRKNKQSYGFGDHLEVEVDRVDLFKRQVDFRLAAPVKPRKGVKSRVPKGA